MMPTYYISVVYMAKKTKTSREKMPKVTKLSQEQMDSFLAELMGVLAGNRRNFRTIFGHN